MRYMHYFHVVKLKSGRFTMRNGRVILLGILCVLFVAAAFGQDQSDPNIITVTEKIDMRELNATVKQLNITVGELNTTVGKLDKTVGELKTTVTKLEERTGIMLNLQYIILAGIFGPLLYSIYQRSKNNARGEATSVNKSEAASTNTTQVSEGDTAPTQVAQVNQSEAASNNPAQANEGEAAPTPTSRSGSPEGEELKDLLKSDDLATKETV